LVTYNWRRYLIIVDTLLVKLIDNLKLAAVKTQTPDDDDVKDLSEVEIEIDNSFFKRKFVPLIHQTLVSSL